MKDDTISRQATIANAISGRIREIDGEKWIRVSEVRESLKTMPSVQPERKAPVSYKEQLSLDCSFCRQHERGDTLYEPSDWDGGIGFDYIRNIRFCPICGRELYDE